jgi:hypothetical protein
MQNLGTADVTCLTSERIDIELPLICQFIIVVITLICIQEHFASPVWDKFDT